MPNAPAARRRAGRVAITTVVASALIATLWGPAANAAPLKDDPAWKAKKEKPVPTKPFKAIPKAADPAEAAAAKPAPNKVTWPKAGAAEVAVPAVSSNWSATLAGGRPAGKKTQAGALPVWIGSAAATTAAAATADATPTKVKVDLARLGADGLQLKLNRTDGVAKSGKVSLQLRYEDFRDAFGGDWAQRLRVVDRSTGKPLAVQNNGSGTLTAEVPVGAQASTFAVQAGPSGGTGNFGASQLAPTATWQVGGSSGDFAWQYPMNVPPSNGGPTPKLSLDYTSGGVDGRTAATNNQPSWGGQGFELQPGGSIEQRFASCASKNEQSGNNGTKATGDLCWAGENATFTLNGRGGELVRDDTTGAWRPRADDGSVIEKLSGADNGDDGRLAAEKGEYWRLTTKDGTKYYFGLNKLPGATDQRTNSGWTVPVFGNHSGEQCFATGNFAGSWCQQIYKWNLDYVVDRHGNTMSLFYDKETNYYGRNSTATAVTPYVRGGNVRTIEYGQRDGAVFSTKAVGKVEFGTAERCLDNSGCAKPEDYPDTPLDQRCIGAGGTQPANCDNKFNPAFFTTKKLTKVSTYVNRGTTFDLVSTWNLRHTFPDNGDGTKPGLWLEAITYAGHVGSAGGVPIPEVNLDGEQLANRVDAAGDNLPEMKWWRVNRVSYGTGGELAVKYDGTDCAPNDKPASADTNGRRCHPMKWTPPGSTEREDWFHKYVVKTVTETDRVTGTQPMVTTVEYPDAPAWRHDDEDGLVEIGQKTWSQWRGYDRTIVRKGNVGGPQIVTENRYFRGMDGDRLKEKDKFKDVYVVDSTGVKVDDLAPLTGQPLETRTFNGAEVVQRTVNEQWVSKATSTRVRPWATVSAFQVQQSGNRQFETLTGGGQRKSQAANKYDDNGVLLSRSDLKDLGTDSDDTCTTYEYTANAAAGISEIPKRELTVGVACGKPYTQDQVISDNRTYYDGATDINAAPERGNVTKTERLSGFKANGLPDYQVTGTTEYDALGRAIKMTNPKNQSSSVVYTPAGPGPVTKVESTKPNGHKTSIELEPAWGQQVATVDEAGKRTEVTYDALGRTTKVWYPGRTGAANFSAKAGANVAGLAAAADNAATADVEYTYGIFANSPSSVTTRTLQSDNSVEDSIQLFDGLMRPRQSKETGRTGGSIVNNLQYDSRGLEVKEDGPFYSDTPVTEQLLIPVEEELPTQKVTQYDLAGRPTVEQVKSFNNVLWETKHTYSGDSETIDPPTGETPVTRVTDVQGRLLELRQYTGDSATGAYDSTKYAYDAKGQLASVTDPAGNKWSYKYDIFGRKIEETDPDKGITTNTYDELDRLITTKDGRGKITAFEYDVLGRTTAKRDGGPTGRTVAEWVYDTLLPGMPTSSTRIDKNGNRYVSRVTGYDDRGRATGSEYEIPANEGALKGTYKFASTYKDDGQLATETLPQAGTLPAETLTYGYNAQDQPTTLASGLSTYVRGTTYTSFGEAEKITMGSANGKWLSIGYSYEDGTRRLSKVTTEKETLPRRVSEVEYLYDDSGNIKQLNDTPSSASGEQTDTQCFSYDYLRRMTGAWTPKAGEDNTPGDCAAAPTAASLGGPAPYWHKWTFDKVGNRESETKTWAGGSTTATYKYPAAGQAQPHAVQKVITTGTGMPAGGRTDTYTYNASGDRTQRTIGGGAAEDYNWNDEGDLESVKKVGGQETSYLYDANGERLIRRDNTGTTLYLGNTELLLKPNATVAEGTRYYQLGGKTVAVRQQDKVSWLGADHHGTSNTAVADNATQTVQRRREDPYGNSRGTAPADWPGQRGFVGGTNDPSTGLVHLGAREYDPTIGKFISVDPKVTIADPQTLNAYTYSNNNPITFSDPDGMSWFSSIVESIKTVSKTVTQRVVEQYKETIQVASTVVTWVRDRATETLEAVKYVVTHPVEVIKQVEKTIKTVVKETVKVAVKVAKKVNEIRKDPVGSIKKAAAAAVKTAKAVAHAAKAVAVKAAKWVYENRAMILQVVAEVALTIAIGAITGGVGALAVRGAMTAIRLAASTKRIQTAARGIERATNKFNSSRVLKRASDEPGPFHNFPESFDDVIFSKGTRTVTQNFFNKPKPGMSNDSIMYKLPGNINGRSGNFEIATRPTASGRSELIMHRFFNPTRRGK
ncbi:RHS repeat-associated core domain-containing protein [Kribbella sandramycini]|uniref:RHS repeat-associated core domain-containing protein n=1 Tax=Kribbella sandramycini TaxID=60450 RepID=A0A7Y4KVZ5_9ACTN|nr:RHS repeat-associated core domain-containing protein [Kribbella sandramycini]MBB6568716.1 RHS repeat-associated protein [Kribbella sandramycini]NOL38701.1 RHS repeat-associated core domain-containing protein [Kribbella sandramycini]